MEGMLALTIVCIIFAIGDFISDKTNAVLSVLLVATVICLVLFWTGLIPSTIFTDAGITPISGMMLGLFIVNMGSLMELREFIAQWKTVVLGLLIVVVGGLMMFAIAIPIIGKNLAVAIVGPITGGFVSAIVVGEVAIPKGLTDVALLATIIVAIQGVIGYPLASMFLKKEAIRLKKGYREGTIKWEQSDKDGVALTDNKKSHKIFKPLPAKMQTPFVLLAKCCIVSLISFSLAALTNGVINKYVMCLIMGVLFREIGFLEYDVMKKSNTYGIGLLIVMTMILVNLTKVTPTDIVTMIVPLILSFVIGLSSLFVVGIIAGKVLGYSWQMSCGIATSCLFGFPGTYVVSNEVANKIGENENEVQMILDNILPKMLIAGFVCLTMTSVIITGFIVRFL